MTKRFIKIFTYLCLLIFSQHALANNICENFDPEPAHFKVVYQQARSVGTDLCLSYGVGSISVDLAAKFDQFRGQIIRDVSNVLHGKSFRDEVLRVLDEFSQMAEQGLDTNNLPSLVVMQDLRDFDSSENTIKFDNNDDVIAKIDFAADECRQPGEPTCSELFDALAVAIEQYKRPYSLYSGTDLQNKAQLKQAAWDEYFEQARSQTFLDALLTTSREQDYLSQGKLVGPMPRQWFAIHPSIVVENVSDAVDGEQISEALAIEWLGVNWWNEDTSPLGFPFGVSLVSIYSDRASVSDSGIGLMLHFNNSTSIGWSRYDDDENGLFVTVDFLSLFAEKKALLDTYESRIKEFRADMF